MYSEEVPDDDFNELIQFVGAVCEERLLLDGANMPD